MIKPVAFLIFLYLTSCTTLKKSDQPKWYYKLQNYHEYDFSNTKESLIVIDLYKNNTELFPKEYISYLNNQKNTTIAYMSIGEAESYRPYFKNLSKKLIANENQNWVGNFPVQYWKEDWHKIIFNYTLKIIEQNFQGTYLDIVDAFQAFPEDLKSQKAQEMANFIISISKLAKTKKPDFKIIIQNGIDIIQYINNRSEFLSAIDGISLEGYIFKYNKNNEVTDINDLNYLKTLVEPYAKANKIILSVEYIKDKHDLKKYSQISNEFHLIQLVTDKKLEGLYFISP